MPIPNIPPGFTVADIKAELGSNSNSLLALGGEVNFSTPFLMSDFAGYSAYTHRYYNNDGVNDYAQITGGAGSNAIGSGALTISLWVKQNATAHQNAQIINIAPGFSSNDRFVFDYNTSSNKLRVNHRSGSTNTMREYYLGNNSSKTGTSGPWTSSARGTTWNGTGWTMLTAVYDGRARNFDGLYYYWNNQQLDYQAQVTGSRTNLAMTNLRIGENIHAVGSAGNATMSFDGFKVYDRLLSSAEISSMYNNGPTGTPISGAIANITFDNGAFVDEGGHFGNGGTTHNGGYFSNH